MTSALEVARPIADPDFDYARFEEALGAVDS
jgi:hypothetical protein